MSQSRLRRGEAEATATSVAAAAAAATTETVAPRSLGGGGREPMAARGAARRVAAGKTVAAYLSRRWPCSCSVLR